MRKRFKWQLIVFFIFLASLFILGGCKFNPTLEERRDEAGTSVQVTYYSNGEGSGFNNNTSVKELTIDLKADSVAFNVLTDSIDGGDSKKAPYTPTRENYTFVGWYTAKLDENGAPITNEKGEVELDQPYFSDDGTDREKLPAGTHLKLYAKWQANVAIKVYLIIGTEVPTEVTFQIKREGATVAVANEEWLYDLNFKNGERHEPSGNALIKASGFTLFDFYTDKACQTEVSWPIQQASEDVIVYAKYIAGNWTYLRNPDDVKNLFAAGAKTDFYLLNDIDCKAVTGLKCVPNFNSVLRGNGYTISNLTINAGQIAGDSTVSMFGNIGKTGGLQDVTFDNVTITTTLISGRQAYAYALFESIWDIASVQNVTLTKIYFTLERSSTDSVFINMNKTDDNGEQWFLTHALFGGVVTNQTEVEENGANILVDRNLTDQDFVDENGSLRLDVDVSEVQIILTVNTTGAPSLEVKLPDTP